MEGAYTPEFTPVAQKGHVVQLDFGSEQTNYQVQRVAPLPFIEADTITVAANDRVSDVDLENLEVWDGWFAQYRMPRLTEELPDSVSIEFDQGGSQSPLYQNKNVRGAITNETPYQIVTDSGDTGVDVIPLTHLLEQFVYEQETPKLTVTNDTAGEVTVGLTFAGWAYEIAESRSSSDQATYVPVESIRGG